MDRPAELHTEPQRTPAESFSSANSAGGARWRQCLLSFVSAGPEAGSFHERARSSDARAPCEADTDADDGAEQSSEGPRFQVTVDSFRVGKPVVFFMTVRRGDAVWQIKRRFRQVWGVHTSLQQGLGRGASMLPSPPPRATLRSAAFGQNSRAFLTQRSVQIQNYVDALLKMITCVDHCEALYKFLCFTNLRSWHYGSMIGGGAPPVASSAVASLPRKSLASANGVSSAEKRGNQAPEKGASKDGGVAADQFCTVCQDEMDAEAEDIRVLPCGHEFHFKCISDWLKQRNTCCVCNGAAVLTAPRFGPPE